MIDTSNPQSIEEYIKQCIDEVFPTWKVTFEEGFAFDDFIERYSNQTNVAFISYEGFGQRAERYEGNSPIVQPDLENFSIYLRTKNRTTFSDEIRTLRDVFQRYSQFRGVAPSGKTLVWDVEVVAGQPTLFTKGFDSFELRLIFS